MREEAKTGQARQLRKKMTEAERLLWYRLRDRRFGGVKFRRQFPIGNYIADFASLDCHLIVEVDGGQHAARTKYDEKRDNFLQQQGFTVMRFWNNEVLSNIEGVLTIMQHQLKVSPHPNPLPQAGEGEVMR